MSQMDKWAPHADRLKELWKQGLSASQIAAILNHEARAKLFTRNAVIGKLHRMGLTFGGGPAKPRTVAAPRKPREPVVRVLAVKPTFTRPPPLRRTPGPVTHRFCQWPMNDWEWGQAHTALFCHEPTQSGSSYCCAHHAKAWVAPIKNPLGIQAYDRHTRRAA